MSMINELGELDATYFGAVGDGSVSPSVMHAAMLDIWGEIQSTKRLARFQRGEYVIEDISFPFRQEIAPNLITELLDVGHGGIVCAGPATVFKTVTSAGSDGGFDCFHLNGLKNFVIKGFPTLTTVRLGTGQAHGANGCSITGGYDGLDLEIQPTDCYRVDAGYADGGKGLTIQCGGVQSLTGTLNAKVRASGCTEGFGFETDLFANRHQPAAVTVELQAKNCYTAVKSVAGAATGQMKPGDNSGVSVTGWSMDCQRDVLLNRAQGIRVDLNLMTTKSKAARRLAPDGQSWLSSDPSVVALYAAYAKNANVRLTGFKGDCDYRALIGATSNGAYDGSTQWSHFDLDIGGTVSTGNVSEIVYGGASMKNSFLRASNTTAVTIPPVMFSPASQNSLFLS